MGLEPTNALVEGQRTRPLRLRTHNIKDRGSWSAGQGTGFTVCFTQGTTPHDQIFKELVAHGEIRTHDTRIFSPLLYS